MTVSKPIPERVHVAKTRKCLNCREPFESEWSGERVCKHCKSLDSWREATTSAGVRGQPSPLTRRARRVATSLTGHLEPAPDEANHLHQLRQASSRASATSAGEQPCRLP